MRALVAMPISLTASFVHRAIFAEVRFHRPPDFDAVTNASQIDFTGTVYTIQTRQYDGTTGRLSPVVRSDRTHDPAYVARTTALLLERDLGLLGTIDSGDADERGRGKRWFHAAGSPGSRRICDAHRVR